MKNRISTLSVGFVMLFLNFACHSNIDNNTKLDGAIDSLIKLNYQQFLKDTVRYIDFRKLNRESISAIFGEPAFTVIDTFEFGNKLTKRELTSNNENYYYERDYNKIPQIIIHKYIWSAGDTTAIVLESAQNSNNNIVPIKAYRIKYSSHYIPLWGLNERNMNLEQILQKRGMPKKEFIDSVFYGFSEHYSILDEIDALKDVPKSVVYRYVWDIDGATKLILFFHEKGFSDESKPIWGYIYMNGAFMLE